MNLQTPPFREFRRLRKQRRLHEALRHLREGFSRRALESQEVLQAGRLLLEEYDGTEAIRPDLDVLVLGLDELPKARLRGYDISPSSIEIAGALAQAAGTGRRARYETRDALDLVQMPKQSADAGICSFLVEHLEDPDKLFRVMHHLLRPGGRAFVTGALTAAQIDHIYEFRNESELVCMAEAQGLRVLETLSTNPNRLLPRARFVPRSMAMLLERVKS